MFKISIDASEADKYLKILRNKAYKTRPLLRIFGDIMLEGVDKNFQQQGRPQKWKPLKNITLQLRKNFVVGVGRPALGTKTKNFGNKILERTGTLRKSVKMKLYPDRVEIGTDVPYAEIHQKGGSIINQVGKASKVDARPFLVITDEEVNKLQKAADDWMFDKRNLRKG